MYVKNYIWIVYFYFVSFSAVILCKIGKNINVYEFRTHKTLRNESIVQLYNKNPHFHHRMLLKQLFI